MKLPYKSGTVRVTSPFGWRTLGGIREYHNGIDLVGSDKTLVSPVYGTVRSSIFITDSTNRTSEWGNYVRIDTDDGLQVFLCHMESRKVKVGDRVKVGDVIGVEGSTGKSTGSHCHFEVRKNGVSVNPCLYLGISNAAGTHTIENAEVCKMDEEKKITDSEPNEWARDAVGWAVDNEIIFGNEDGDLMLRQPCTREQMLVFLHRFAQSMGKA